MALLLGLTLSSCHVTRMATVTTRDTLTSLKTVSLPFDTTVKVKGRALTYATLVPIIKGKASMPSRIIEQNGIKASISIVRGVLHVNAMTKDTTVAVKGSATGQIAEHTYRQKDVVTVTKELSWWGRVCLFLKNFLFIILLIIVVIIILFFALK